MRHGSTFIAAIACALGAACTTPSSPGDGRSAPEPRAEAGITDAGGTDAGGTDADARATDGAHGTDAAPSSFDATTADAPSSPVSGPARTDGGAEANGPPDAADGPALPAKVLLYHFSTLVIDSVPAQLAFFKSLLAGWGYATDDSVDPGKFTDEGLAAYAAVAMINTCFFPFGDQKDGATEAAALQRFLARGGGLFGTHCAAVTFQSTSPPPLYNHLIGGQGGDGFFDGTSACRTLGTHPTIDALPSTFTFVGNLDNNEALDPTSTILVRCKWGAGDMKDVAVSWVRSEGLGRVFYTDFGKVDTDLTDPTLGGAHIVPGLAWVLRR
jgi:hypothetical protein